MKAVHEYRDFYASHDHMPGSARTMRVTGTVVFRTGGWSCSLRECTSGINPQMLCLELLLEPPAPGAPVTDALTPCSVEWAVDDPASEYQQVQFRINTEDEPPATIDVEHVQ